MSNLLKIIAGLVVAFGTLALCPRFGTTHTGAAAVGAATTAAAVSPSVAAEFGDKITLTGILPDEATRTRLLAKAGELHGADRIVDQLTINPAARGAWLDTDALWSAVLPSGAVRSTFDGSNLILEGQVASEELKQQAGAAASDSIAQLGGTASVDNRITVSGPSAAQTEIASILNIKNVEFETSKAVITSRGRTILDEVYAVLERTPGARFEVAGHTDNRGDAQMNRALSEARAAAVIDYLASKGLASARFEAKGYGADKPVADNGTVEGRQRNRRIEFVQIGG